MTDVGSTTFGYVIAYLLPGLSASIGIGLLSPHAGRVFRTVIDEQNLALGLLGALIALALGIFLTLFRGLVVEEWIWRDRKITPEEHSELSRDEDTYRGYRSIIDELYRYHQFWGGMAIAVPLLVAGVVVRGSEMSGLETAGLVTGLVALELGALWAANATYRRYITRMRLLLSSGEAQRAD